MEVSADLADRVLRLVHSPDYRPAKPKKIAALLEVGPDDFRELRRVIKWLVLQGQLVYGSNHLVMTPATAGGEPDVVRGTFRHAAGGFGFLRPQTRREGETPDDLFIPQGATAGAMDGDLVEARLRPRSDGRGRGGTEAYVDRVLERARRQFTGTFQTRDGAAVVFLDGTPYDEPVEVGDIRGLPLEQDDKVVVELVAFPDSHGAGGEGVILEVLGSSKNPRIDTLAVMRQYGLPEEFPAEVIEDARRQADAFDDSHVPADRRDLTDLLTVTIDPHDARDFDDAISLQHSGGHWTLWVHIADVTHFVPPGGPLDHEARQRATSTYLPDRVVPMLPEIISNHLASLQPERLRYAKTVQIEMTEGGIVTSTEVYASVIRSDKRFNYEQIDRFLADREEHVGKWGEEICQLLSRMHQLAMILRRRRIERGALNLALPEVKIQLDKAGKVRGAFLVTNTESHQVIEEFMLAANEAVATWLDDMHLRFLRRVHALPERRKLRQLTRFVRDLGIPCEEMEDRFEIQHVLDEVAGTPLEYAVNYAVLKAMSKAVYSPDAEGHYALNSEHYCHFTSPIRRYPDLTVHRIVARIAAGEKTPDESYPELLKMGFHCSDQERNSEAAERTLVLIKLLHHLNKFVGQTMEAVINRVYPDGLYARCIKLPVDGYVGIKELPPDTYRFERRGQMMVGFKAGNRFRLGDHVLVKIARVDLRDRQLYLTIEKNYSSGEDPTPRAKPGKAKARVGTRKKKTKPRRKRR